VTDVRQGDHDDDDTGLPCTPLDVERVRITEPQRTARGTAINALNGAALEGALAGIGAMTRGHCRPSRSEASALCSTDRECDSRPGSGDGRCRDRLMAFDPPLSERDRCTHFAEIVVPLRHTEKALLAGHRRIALRTTPSRPISGRRPLGDVGSIDLFCRPPK